MEDGTIRPVNIDEEMRDSYLDYAMSVIVSRALPDARDGLKPVHRRILYAMYDMGVGSNVAYKKSARIVGEVLGKYHPHSDAAVYDAMARMAQDFSMRYPLVDGQGNFGSIDGDSPAAMRYTEARLMAFAEEMLADIEKDTVAFEPNFDGTLQEPVVLPARLPNLLLNGTSGIAVGMATNIPPHNLREIAQAVDYLIEQMIAPEAEEIDENLREVSAEDLMRFVQGPDFPTGGIIIGAEGIRSAYATGKGRVVVRAVTNIETRESGRDRIVITEIPYQINKTTILERIADLVRSGRIDAISDLRDESDRRGLTIVVELKRGAQPAKVLNQLLKYTPLQTTFSVQMLALVNGEPRLLPLKVALRHYIEHRREVIRRRTEFDLMRARRRAHILEGLLIALGHLDAVIQTIRESTDASAARENLISRFNLSEEQAQAILDMQLRRLAALERQQIEEEHRELLIQIEYLEDLLKHPKKILQQIRDDLNTLADRYGDVRKTHVAHGVDETISIEDLVKDEDVLVFITSQGYIKRVSASAYRTQRRGGRGVTGITTREEDDVEHLFSAGSLDSILFFTNQGKVYQIPAYEIPETSRAAKGLPLRSVLTTLEHNERITAAVAVPDFGVVEYCTMVTRLGRIKRVAVGEFEAVRPSGLIAIALNEGDELAWVKLTSGGQDIIIATEQGMGIRFNEDGVRVMGRAAAGVHAIRRSEGDSVAGMDVIDDPSLSLMVITENGYGKRTPLEDYRRTSRYGVGVRTLAKDGRTGRIIEARVVGPSDEIALITAGGRALRTTVEAIPFRGRATLGVHLMNLSPGESLVSVALLNSGRQADEGGDLPFPEDGLEVDGPMLLDDEEDMGDEEADEYEE
jgi:DNA gyrase subunit A